MELNEDVIKNICDIVSEKIVDEIFKVAKSTQFDTKAQGILIMNIIAITVARIISSAKEFRGQEGDELKAARKRGFKEFIWHVEKLLIRNGVIDAEH